MNNTEKVFRIGTRGSALALWQARWVETQLCKMFPKLRIELKIIKTSGDKNYVKSLATFGQKGLFTKELDQALLKGRIDLAVHSLKDLPADPVAGLALVAVPRRADPHDALISADYPTLEHLPANARIGTGSPRRSSQLCAWRPDLQCQLIRGNLDTRLHKMRDGHYDAIILAAAGLRRLGRDWEIRELIPYSIMLPAVGQGALGIVCRKDDQKRWRRLNDPRSMQAVRAERELLRQLGGGCHVPIAGLGRVRAGKLLLVGRVADPKGKQLIAGQLSGSPNMPEDLGRKLASRLIDQGAGELLDPH